MKGVLGRLGLVVFGLLLADLVVGGYLLFGFRMPELVRGLPVEKMHVVGHPYKAYMLNPGQSFWKGPIPYQAPGANPKSVYFDTLPEVVIDEFGHSVLPEDLQIDSRKKAPGEFRILFLGGSTTFQPWPFLVTDVLTRRSVSGRKFVAISAGTGGYTSQENLVDLALTGFTYRPDLVVAYLPVNDIYHAAHWKGFKRDYSHMRIPLESYSTTAPTKPEPHLRPYPFVWRLFDSIAYRKQIAGYINQLNLTYYTNKQPDPGASGHLIDEQDFEGTVLAVIDNVLNMKAICDAHGIPFVLMTQKLFPLENSYTKVMDGHTTTAINRMLAAPELKSIPTLEMSKLVPDAFTPEARRLVAAAYPSVALHFDQPMSYDTMHFNPSALRLFAAITAERLPTLVPALH